MLRCIRGRASCEFRCVYRTGLAEQAPVSLRCMFFHCAQSALAGAKAAAEELETISLGGDAEHRAASAASAGQLAELQKRFLMCQAQVCLCVRNNESRQLSAGLGTISMCILCAVYFGKVSLELKLGASDIFQNESKACLFLFLDGSRFVLESHQQGSSFSNSDCI